MTKYTLQETFDTVARHLLRQSAQSLMKGDDPTKMICAYRGDSGLKCAAGCLIPDDEYSTKFEKPSAGEVVPFFDLGDFFGHAVDLVVDLQECHDSVQVDVWKDRLRKIGKDWELECSVLDSFKWDEATQRYQEST